MFSRSKIDSLIYDLKHDLNSDVIRRVNDIMFSFDEEVSSDIDIILVLGSSSINRAKKALEVYKKLQRPIVVSGGIKRFDGVSEAVFFGNYLIENGVSKDFVYVDDTSTNTEENFINSFRLIKSKFYDNKRILLITSSQHMLRALLTANKVINDNNYAFSINTCPSYPDEIKRDNWYLQEDKVNIIIGELERLIKYDLVK